jgi:hypothetical protein
MLGWIDSNEPPSSAPKEDRDAFDRIARTYAQQWDEIPGFLGFGSVGCETKQGCRIAIVVQSRLMKGVRDAIPETIDGQRIVVVPADYGC